MKSKSCHFFLFLTIFQALPADFTAGSLLEDGDEVIVEFVVSTNKCWQYKKQV